MNVPSYEVGRVAALTVRLMRASGLSHADALAALGLASRMIHDDLRAPGDAPAGAGGLRPPADERARPTRHQ